MKLVKKRPYLDAFGEFCEGGHFFFPGVSNSSFRVPCSSSAFVLVDVLILGAAKVFPTAFAAAAPELGGKARAELAGRRVEDRGQDAGQPGRHPTIEKLLESRYTF